MYLATKLTMYFRDHFKRLLRFDIRYIESFDRHSP